MTPTDTDTDGAAGGASIVIVTELSDRGSATLLAVSLTVTVARTAAGAVYKPLGVTVPTGELKVHVTA